MELLNSFHVVDSLTSSTWFEHPALSSRCVFYFYFSILWRYFQSRHEEKMLNLILQKSTKSNNLTLVEKSSSSIGTLMLKYSQIEYSQLFKIFKYISSEFKFQVLA